MCPSDDFGRDPGRDTEDRDVHFYPSVCANHRIAADRDAWANDDSLPKPSAPFEDHGARVRRALP